MSVVVVILDANRQPSPIKFLTPITQQAEINVKLSIIVCEKIMHP